MLFPPSLIEYIPLSQIKMSEPKKTTVNQVLKENGYQEITISKIFKRITNKESSPHSQQQMEATDIQKEEIRMTINLL